MRSKKIRFLLGTGLALTGGVAALTWSAFAQNPLPQSPVSALPYNWNTSHSGGIDNPNGASGPTRINADPGNGISTPTGSVPVTIGGVQTTIRTQFPSYLLGDVDSANPLDPNQTTAGFTLPSRYYNFRQSDTGGNYIYEWFAPFVYNTAAPTLVTDDSNTAFFSPSVLPSAPWTRMTSASGVNGEYIYAPLTTVANATTNPAIWTLNVAAAGSYYVSVHAPVLTDASLPAGSRWSMDSHYVVNYIDGTGTAQHVSVRKIVQTGQNTLIGPVTMQGTQNITVVLDNGTLVTPVPTSAYVVADTASLTPATTGATTIDDGGAGWTQVRGGWGQITLANGVAGLASIANTATNREYRRISAVTSLINPSNVTWSYTVPATGFYNVTFHIPDSEQNLASLANPEYRVTDAHYTLKDTTTGKVWFDGHVSQTEANYNQPLGSTVYAAAGDKLVVTLYNTTAAIAHPGSTYIVADSVTFTPGTGADASAPAVAVVGDPNTDNPNIATAANEINDYPEIADALYYGPLPGTINQIDNALPHGYQTVLNDVGNDPAHKVRMLVYFGRRETAYANGKTYSAGTVYCVDGITGSVVWMFRTPPIDYNPADKTKATTWQDGDTSILSSPAVARINVCVRAAGGSRIYATKLCVVVSDNNGRVYCLDAIGNRDGKGLQPNNGYTYNDPAEAVSAASHVGTTTAYWIFRPDPLHPKYLYGPNKGAVKPATAYDENSDMPPPSGFSTAAPVIYVDKSVAMDFSSLNAGKTSTAALGPNAVVYVGNSNGVLYALDASGGVFADTDTRAASAADHDTYYNTIPLIPINQTGLGQTDQIMTTHCRWWYSTRGPVPSPLLNGSISAHASAASRVVTQARAQTAAVSRNAALQKAAAAKKAGKKAVTAAVSARPKTVQLASTRRASFRPLAAVPNTNADIESAPAIYVDPAAANHVTVIFGTAHEQESTSNIGHVIALRDSIAGDPGWNGPIGNSGLGDQSNILPATTAGYPNYNVDPVEAWAFPQIHSKNAQGKWQKDARSALGNITGSPVVFANPQQTLWGGTYIYVAANSGVEIPVGGTTPVLQPAEDTTGRIWCLNPADGTMKFAYPSAIDPNIAPGTGNSVYEKPEPSAPIGAFLHATPAIGTVTFPKYIQYTSGGAVTNYVHVDASYPAPYGIARGPDPANPPPANVPMLYVGCRGQNDNGFYAIDIDGNSDAERFIYRVPSPDGADFQSASALIVNSYSAAAPYVGPGGMVYCSAGGSLFQFSATPLSNDGGQAFPQVTVDAFNGFGPVSSASLGGPDVTDLKATAIAGETVVEDYLFAGDSTSGFMHAITPRPNGSVLGGIDVGGLLPGTPDSPLIPTQQLTLREPLHIHIIDPAKDATSTDIATNEAKIGATLPMFEWGDNIYIRFTNVVPSNPADAPNAPIKITVPTADGMPTGSYMTNGSPISFQISDYDFDGNFNGTNDGGVVNNYIVQPSGNIGKPTNADFNGFNRRTTLNTAIDPLVDATGRGYYGAYSYALRDGTGRMNTPGARRKVINARQTAELRAGDTSLVGNVTLESLYIPAGSSAKVNQSPTFGILNPIAEVGGGVPVEYTQAQGIANDSSIGPIPLMGSQYRNLALTNGNLYIDGDETKLPKNGDDGAGTNGDPTALPTAGGSTLSSAPRKYGLVFTATGLLNHNGSGDNGTGSDWGLRIYDRSHLYLNNQLLNVAMERSGLHWNDPINLTGAGTVINRLPWDTMPSSWNTGVNSSLDYPDMTRDSVSYTLDPAGAGTDIGDVPGGAPIKIQGSTTQAQYTYLPVKVGVDVPQYQPANLAEYPLPSSASSVSSLPSGGHYTDGYHTRVRVFVDTNRNGHWDTGEAYRDVDLQSGVAVDMGTDIVENTADVGAEPHGFGIQTGGYASLGAFSPFNPKFSSSFVPLTVHNDGNVNLLNVQFNQKLVKHPLTGNNINDTLKMTSDSEDALSVIPAFDLQSISGGSNYLLRSSLDADQRNIGINPGFAGAGYTPPGFTFHKARVGDGAPPTLTVPDVPHDNLALPGSGFSVANTQKPAVGVAVPIGTPSGNYSRLIRVFEGSAPNSNPLNPPSYTGNLNGQSWLDVIQSPADRIYHGAQTASITGTTVHVRVTESRITNGTGFGTLPQIDATRAAGAANYAPAAYRDAYWDGSGRIGGTGRLGLYYAGSRPAGAFNVASVLGTDIFGYYLPFTNPAYVPGDNSAAWWHSATTFGLGSLFDPANLPTTSYAGVSLAQDPEVYTSAQDSFSSGGKAYILYNTITGSANKYSTALTCALLSNGVPGTSGVVTTTTAPVYHPRAAVYNGVPWVFWHTGGRGSTQIYYSYLTSSNPNGGLIFSPPAVLNVPASVSQVSDPIPAPVTGPTSTTDATPVSYLDVTYAGVAPNGESNIYASRYLPITKTGATVQTLALAAIPQSNEFLQPDAGNTWWYARDTGWLRNSVLDISLYHSVYQAYMHLGLTNGKLDPGTGLLVFGNVANPLPNNTGPLTVYMDLAAGRVRFSPELPVGESVYATFQPLARKITTDSSRPSTDPVTFIDDSFAPNGAGQRVPLARYWYIFRKTSPPGVSKAPTLYYKTQRLMVAVSDQYNKPISFPLSASGIPQIVVKTGSDVLFDGAGGSLGNVSVDWQRGRVYFPQVVTGSKAYASEGLPITITVSGITTPWSDIVRWSDELMGSDPTAPSGVQPTNGGVSLAGNASTNEREIPIYNPVNEGSVSAFLDPFAYANVAGGSYQVLSTAPSSKNTDPSQDPPHTVWLFWSSSRNGASDIYSMTIDPKFTVDTAGQ